MAKCATLVLRIFQPYKNIYGNVNAHSWKRCTNMKDVPSSRTSVLFYSTSTSVLGEDKEKKVKVSKAMKAYLERAEKHDTFLKEQLHQYNVGKRHLANMMGEDPETFTQQDIDRAIEYLFPSGLFEPNARPMMKHPDEIFPPRKAAEFDETGRPHHFLFYTGKPNLYNLFFDIVDHLKSLNDFEDKMIKKQLKPDITQALNSSGLVWIPKEELERILVERLTDREYNDFVKVMERVVEHPYSYRMKDFIEKFRKPIMQQSSTFDIPKPQYDADGRAYVTTKECLRKRARGEVTIRCPGTGEITINNSSIEYFESLQEREQLLFPLLFTNMLGAVDIDATVAGGGPSGQAGAVRWGIAMSLRSFVDKEMVERMRIAGLLQRDYRKRERKKPGQAGARRKYTWKKR